MSFRLKAINWRDGMALSAAEFHAERHALEERVGRTEESGACAFKPVHAVNPAARPSAIKMVPTLRPLEARFCVLRFIVVLRSTVVAECFLTRFSIAVGRLQHGGVKRQDHGRCGQDHIEHEQTGFTASPVLCFKEVHVNYPG